MAFGGGLVVIVATWTAMMSTFVLPRGRSRPQLVALGVTRGVREVFVGLSHLTSDFARKDSVLAAVGPASLLAQLVVFLGLFVVGYALAMAPWARSVPAAFADSGSAVFVVGLAGAARRSNDVLAVLAAATGAISIALQIGYLPTIYQAFNRRESLVTLMEARAGVPAWGPELLVRHQLVHSLDALVELYKSWEDWAAEVAESHVSYPVLLYFRSPEPGFSWILSLLTILDAAAMHLALCPASAPSQARMCLRMGFTALRRVATALRITYDPDPLPGAPIRLSFEEFRYAVGVLEEVGFPAERSAEEAWPHFHGWRVNYEPAAQRIADRIVAPSAPWSGERRHLGSATTMPDRPPHRSPGGAVFQDSKYRPEQSGTGAGRSDL
ncbi:MAG: hypothetical protein ACRDZ5_10885 [Acidimicrobiales bacterium]